MPNTKVKTSQDGNGKGMYNTFPDGGNPVSGNPFAVDTTSTAFVNTAANAKNITLKNKAGDSGFSFDTNGTVITINRVAG